MTDEGRMANGQTLDEYNRTHCGACMACPVCKRRVERDEEHLDGCSDRGFIRACDKAPYAVVLDSEYEVMVCKDHWDQYPEENQKNLVRFVHDDQVRYSTAIAALRLAEPALRTLRDGHCDADCNCAYTKALDAVVAALKNTGVSTDSQIIAVDKSVLEAVESPAEPTPGDAKAALYLAALEALLADLPAGCDDCGLPAEWEAKSPDYGFNWLKCELHKIKTESEWPSDWKKVESPPSLAMARAAIGWEAK